MLNIIKKQLLKMISDIDVGNCYLSEEEEIVLEYKRFR